MGVKITPQNRIKRNLQKIGAIKFSSKCFFFLHEASLPVCSKINYSRRVEKKINDQELLLG